MADEDGASREQKEGEAPPAWWKQAWNAIERKLDVQTRHMTDKMERMFSIQSQCRDTLEVALEKEANITRHRIQELENKVGAESKERAMGMQRVAVCIKNIEETLKYSEVRIAAPKRTSRRPRSRPRMDREHRDGYHDTSFWDARDRAHLGQSSRRRRGRAGLAPMDAGADTVSLSHAPHAEQVWRDCGARHQRWPGAQHRLEDSGVVGEERRRTAAIAERR